MSAPTTEAVAIGRRFQKVISHRFSHQIQCVAPQGTESVAVHYTVGADHITSVYPLNHHCHSQKRVSTEKTVQHFLYAKKCRMYVMFCADLTLRVFSESLQHLQTVPTTSTTLCMEFVESTSVLYTGESGFVKAWHLRPQLYYPLVPLQESTIPVGKNQWVTGLECEEEAGVLTAVTGERVVLIDTNLHQQISTFPCKKNATVTGSLLFSTLGYLVIAFNSGAIEVVNTAVGTTVHKLSGHIRAVTALKRHVTRSCVISSSLDGTVRVWDLETLTECNRLDLCVEVVGMSVSCYGEDTAQLVCHSHHDITVWHLSQLESGFASVYSSTVELRRVESPGVSRIMATAEDGSVRLLSPSTGEVVTTFFPIFTSDIMREVAYCPLGGLLFALLATGDVLVVSTHTNPCSTLQLWTTPHRKKLQTICTCVVVWRGKTESLVFGGSVCGHISLLHSSLFSMDLPCPAHGGPVCQLVSSSSPIELAKPSSPAPSLVSFGTDNLLNVWSLRVNDKTSGQVGLKIMIVVQMESAPVQIGLLGTLMCVTTPKNSLEVLEVSPELTAAYQNSYLPLGCPYHALPVLTHQREDRHTHTITSLTSSPQLCLLVTTSLDGLVKVWNSSNQLVAEIDFGQPLLSACFVNSRGDLLVGFQRRICRVNSSHYLPSHYPPSHLHLSPHSQLSLGHTTSSTHIEQPIRFDSSLQFWYDSKWVPTYPADMEKRRKQCSNASLDNYYASVCTSDLVQERVDSGEMGEMGDSGEMGERGDSGEMGERGDLTAGTSEILETQLTRSDSRHLVAAVVETTPTDTPTNTPSLSSLQEAIVSSLEAIQSMELGGVSSDRRRRHTQYQKRQVGKFPAEVVPLQTPFSPHLPIAPDCLVPNSTVRERIGYVPAPDPLSLIQQSAIERLLPSSPDSKPDRERFQYRRRRRRRRREGGGDCELGEGVESSASVSEESDRVSDDGAEFSGNGVKEEYSEEWVNEFSEVGVNSPVVTPSTSGSTACDINENCEDGDDGSLVMVTAVEPDPSPQEVGVTPEPSVPSLPLATESNCSAKDQNEKSVVGMNKPQSNSPTEDSITTPPSALAVETKVLPRVTIPFHVGPPKTTLTTKPAPPQRATAVVHGGGVTEVVGCEGVRVCEVGDSVLERVTRTARFSSNLIHSITSVHGVCEEIVSMLRYVDAESMDHLTSAIAELKMGCEVSEVQLTAMAEVLITRLGSTVESHTHCSALRALQEVGVAIDDITTLQAILPLLLDSNEEVRRSAFGALRVTTGIANRSQLHKRLIDMGVLQHIEYNEDEALRGVSKRLELERETVSLSTTRQHTPRLTPPSRPRRGCCEGDGDSGASGEGVIGDGVRTPHIVRVSTPCNTRRRRNSRDKRERSSGELSLKKQLPSRISHTHFIRAKLTHHQPLYPIATSRCGEPRLTNQAGARPISPGSVLAETRTHTLQKMLVTHPTLLSRSTPIRELMRGAYPSPGAGSGGRGTGRKEREFKWSDVFPVVKRGNVRNRDSRKREIVELKLPRISPNN